MSFMNIKAGQNVKFRQYAGMGRNGPEWKDAVGKAQMMLIFADHVVVNLGGKYGKPAVVDASNFVGVM